MNRFWKAWLAFAGCVPADIAAVISGNVTAIVVAAVATVTATGAVLFGPSNAAKA